MSARDSVLIVGAGLAGLFLALKLAPRRAIVLSQAPLGQAASSAWAQGGLAAALAPEDNPSLHAQDTVAAGAGLVDPVVARLIADEGPARVMDLIALGVPFDRTSDGKLAQSLEAAHSRPRVVRVSGDLAGKAIMDALIAAARAAPHIEIVENARAVALLHDANGAACGVLGQRGQEETRLKASEIVLATGGSGGLFAVTTNPPEAMGHGLAMASRLGALIADPEFVQFHPTAIDIGRDPAPLATEALRGEGAILINDKGERFMPLVHDDAELAPRDVVARAISAELARGGRVFLDARAALGDRFATRFPVIDALCREAGLDASRQLIPVRPAVHYHMGGVATDAAGRSSIAGLWVAGEAASTGLHGANRLASNSRLEAAVMGIRAARDILATPTEKPSTAKSVVTLPAAADPSPVRPIVSRHLGVLRNAGAIHGAVAHLLPLVEAEGPASDPAIVALLIAVFASLRAESRGAHARTDFPLKRAEAVRRKMTLSDVLEIARATASHPLARSA